MKGWQHAGFILAALFVTLGIPSLLYGDVGSLLRGGGGDAVTGASLALPDQPSGEFIVLLNEEKHGETMEEWRSFLTGEPVGVIMEDLSCLVAKGDSAGAQLADRYRARLAENQMTVRAEDPLLVVSRAEQGLFDAAVFSREMADACRLDTVLARDRIGVIQVKGAEP